MKVQASIRLPYLLKINDGEYGKIKITRETDDHADGGPGRTRTVATLTFESETEDLDKRQQEADKKATALLQAVNHLIRWYRVHSRKTLVIEITKAQASPFTFLIEPEGEAFVLPINFASVMPREQNVSNLSELVKKGADGKDDPPVGELFLLDAEQAMLAGRFRETVLFCWSTIDAVFNTKYKKLVVEALPKDQDWDTGREHLIGTGGEIGLRTKMTAILRLVTGRSLYEDRDLWNRLSNSYKKRNAIIHAGETATEEEAQNALGVAREVVQFMENVQLRQIPSSGEVTDLSPLLPTEQP